MIILSDLKYLRCISITVFCVLIVMQSFAQALQHSAAPNIQKMSCDTVQSPIDDSPCKDNHESGQCDLSSTCCVDFEVLPQKVTFQTPFSAEVFPPSEPPLLLPQIYLPIFVPPQNNSLTRPRPMHEQVEYQYISGIWKHHAYWRL